MSRADVVEVGIFFDDAIHAGRAGRGGGLAKSGALDFPFAEAIRFEGIEQNFSSMEGARKGEESGQNAHDGRKK